AEDGIRAFHVTGVQTCALPIFPPCCAEAPPGGRRRDRVRARRAALFFGSRKGAWMPPPYVDNGAIRSSRVVDVQRRDRGGVLVEIGRASCRERGEGSAPGVPV